MLTIADPAPDFTLPGIYRDKASDYRLRDKRGRWLVLFFYPNDFSFVCPTEVKGFSRLTPAFHSQGADILGVSVDSIDSHRAWIQEIGGVDYPLLSDPEHKVCRLYHVLHPRENVALRATFIVDPSGVIQYSMASGMNIGRSVEETLRAFRAVCTGKLCPADWQPGEATAEPTRAP